MLILFGEIGNQAMDTTLFTVIFLIGEWDWGCWWRIAVNGLRQNCYIHLNLLSLCCGAFYFVISILVDPVYNFFMLHNEGSYDTIWFPSKNLVR